MAVIIDQAVVARVEKNIVLSDAVSTGFGYSIAIKKS